jgi:hypothetical protein
MGERDWREEAPAPGNWRVTAQPLSMAATPARSEAATAAPAVAPSRTGGRPLLATLICAGVLALSLAGQGTTPMESGGGSADSVGYILGGAVFGAILWGIAFAITIRKASTGWKAGSLVALAVLGGLVALSHLATAGAAPPAAPVQVPVVREGK